MTHHIFITEGETKQRQGFQLYQKGNEIQLYWDDGELNSHQIQPWETASQVAQQWKQELES